jgi:hypothetical protein
MSAVTAFLSSLRADLLDRRMLPVLLAVVAVLLAAIAYAAFGSAGSVATPPVPTIPAAVPATGSGTTGIAISQVSKGSTGPVSEVTSGAALQHAGPTRDPLAAPAVKQAAHKKTAAAIKVSGSSSPKASTPARTVPVIPKPAQPKRTKKVQKVDLFFGIVPAGTTTPLAGLQPYGDLTKVTPLPSATENLIELVAVSGSIKAARFKFIQPMIPTGAAKCIPSPTQCEAIDLKPGEFEALEYAPPGGGVTVLYQLQLFSITEGEASAASVSAARRR